MLTSVQLEANRFPNFPSNMTRLLPRLNENHLDVIMGSFRRKLAVYYINLPFPMKSRCANMTSQALLCLQTLL